MKPRVLFVDDEERIVNLLRVMFRPTCEVFTATCGKEALKIIREQHIHVIVSDQRMPEMLGIELLDKVRAHSPDTMRILLTGYSDLSAIVGSVNDGEVFRFISKPWDQDEIKSIVAEAAAAATETEPNLSLALVLNEVVGVASTDVEIKTAKRDILVLDDHDEDRRLTVSMLMLENLGHVHAASNFAEALKVLEKNDVGLIVLDAYIKGQSTAPFLSIIKQQHPAISAIMLTEMVDADFIIKLINQTQIYRFVNKPIKQVSFGLAVMASLRLHEGVRKNPKLASRYKVTHSEEVDAAPFASGLRSILNNLRERLKLFA
jgi:serine/threonine-protein kinase